MRFSVIVPVHNAEKYIEKAVESVVSAVGEEQDLCELLLIENGSKDGSALICDRYEKDIPFVRTVHLGPSSAYDARQEGIKLATGDFLVFMDADDAVAADIFDVLGKTIADYEKSGECPEVILYNAAEMASPQSKMFPFPFEEGRIYSGEDKQEFYALMCSGDMLNAMWNKCLSRDLARNAVSGGAMKMNYGEDLLQTAEIIDCAKSIAYIDRILYFYRINEEGLTGGYHENFMEDQEKSFEGLDAYAKKWAGDKYRGIIDERKTLTCTIGMKKLVYSSLPFSEVRRKMNELMTSGFYKKYANGRMPDWASEEDEYVYEFMKSGAAGFNLMRLCIRTRLKSYIKARIRKNGI